VLRLELKNTIVIMQNPNQLLARITQNPYQCGGRPRIRGMRIMVNDILGDHTSSINSTSSQQKTELFFIYSF
jgi:hypothetical protein